MVPLTVQEVALVGDRRPFLVALIVPDFEVLARRGGKLGIAGLTRGEQARHTAVRAAVEREIQQASRGFARHEQVRRFLLLDRELTPDTGELTPTLKLKRRVIEANLAGEIEALYEGHGTHRVPAK